jgi:WD40 repeat protein/energy-coupling factor transporter ATP-binding protein EcfA2
MSASYYSEIGGDFKGIQGDISGGIINQYIITQKSGVEITNQPLIPGSPYVGLTKFKEKDKDKFFGRDSQICDLSKYLEENKLLLLMGISGSGKSSLVLAGLIPYLEDKWGTNKVHNLTFEPAEDPFTSLKSNLANKYRDIISDRTSELTEDILIKLVNRINKDYQRTIIFIDQFEELFTITSKNKQKLFIKCLLRLIEQQNSSAYLVMTMRSDFLGSLSPYPELATALEKHIRIIKDMTSNELRLAIAEPAARNHVIFEDNLVNIIIKDFFGQAGSLPLLQYTLDLLWEKDKELDGLANKCLKLSTYQNEDFGGVAGALQKQANDIFYNKNNKSEYLDELEQKAAKKIFITLIGLEVKEPISKRADKSIFEKDDIQKKTLNKLIDNRLLVSKQEDGMGTVEVAHEALLRSWTVLQDLIRENEEIIILRNRLSADVKQWDELRKKDSKQANAELWSGAKLARIVELEKEQSVPNLGDVAREFIQASVALRDQEQKERSRRRQLTISGLVGGLAVALILAGVATIAWRNAAISEINSLAQSSDGFLNLNKPKAIKSSVKAAVKMQHQLWGVDANTRTQVELALLNTVHNVAAPNTLGGHANSVNGVSFSPDGKMLASASDDYTVKLWDTSTKKEIRTLTEHTNSVNGVSFSPNGKMLASASSDNTVKLWDTSTGQEIKTLTGGHKDAVNGVSFSPNGKMLASASSDNTVKLWDTSTRKEIKTLTGHREAVYRLSFSPDGRMLASASADKTVKLWDTSTRKEIKTLTGHTNSVWGVSFSPDGKILASASADNTVKLWDTSTKKEIKTLTGHTNSVAWVSFSSDGKMLASASLDNKVKLWDASTKKEIKTLTGHTNSVWGVSFSSDGKMLASASADNTVKLWDTSTKKEIKTLTGHTERVEWVSFNLDGRMLASASADNTVKLWDTSTRKEIITLTGHKDAVNGVSFSPNVKMLASASSDNTVILWDTSTRKEIITLTGHREAVNGVSFSPNGKMLASASSDNTVILWDTSTRKEIKTLNGHKNWVWGVSFSPDGKILASASADNTVKLWDTSTRKEIKTLNGHKNWVWGVSFSRDGKILASASSDNTVKLWDTSTRKEIKTLTGHTDKVYRVSFRPDGKLASASADQTVKLWDTSTGQEIKTLNGHTHWVLGVSFSPDGKMLASASRDKTVKLWRWDFDYLLKEGCNFMDEYFKTNPVNNESDKNLCDGVGIPASVNIQTELNAL